MTPPARERAGRVVLRYGPRASAPPDPTEPPATLPLTSIHQLSHSVDRKTGAGHPASQRRSARSLDESVSVVPHCAVQSHYQTRHRSKNEDLKLAGVALVAMFAMAIVATSAFGLPIVTKTSGSGQLKLNFESSSIASELETTAGGLLAGTGLKVLYF